MTQMSLYDRCDFLRDTRDTVLPRGTPWPASPQCSFTCCAECLWILCCFFTPKQTSCLRVCSSPAFLGWYVAFLCSTTLFFPSVISRPYSKESRGHGIRVTRFTRRELKRSFSLLSRKLYRIIYKRVRIRYTTTAHGLWSQARVHWVAQGHGVTGCFPWCGRQGSFLSSYLLYKFLSLQLNSLNLIAREGFWPQVSLSLPCSILNSGWYRTFYSVCAIE